MVIDSGFEVINTGLGANYTSVTLVTGFLVTEFTTQSWKA